MVLSFHDNIKKIARKNLAFRNAGAMAVEEQMRRAWGQ